MAICFLKNLTSWLVVASFSHDVFPFDFVDIDTRRRAACDLVRGLCKFFEGPVTGIFSGYVNSMLQENLQVNAPGSYFFSAVPVLVAVFGILVAACGI